MKSGVYTIPAKEMENGAKLCFYSTMNFWESAKYVAEKGGLHIATGLFFLGIEELGKFALLRDALAKSKQEGDIIIEERLFKHHGKKLEKGRKLLGEWGMDLSKSNIVLAQKERERLWFVSWDEKAKKFKRNLEGITIVGVATLEELIRRGLLKMKALAKA